MNMLHELKGFKVNHEKEVNGKAAHSCHKGWLIRPNPAMEMAEEKTRPCSHLWTQTQVLSIQFCKFTVFLSLELGKLLFLASPKDAAMPQKK